MFTAYDVHLQVYFTYSIAFCQAVLFGTLPLFGYSYTIHCVVSCISNYRKRCIKCAHSMLTMCNCKTDNSYIKLTLKVLVATIDAQWEGMGDVGSARYEPVLLPPYPTIRVLSYSSL